MEAGNRKLASGVMPGSRSRLLASHLISVVCLLVSLGLGALPAAAQGPSQASSIQPPGGNALAPQSAAPFWLPYTNDDLLTTLRPRIAVDANGGTHVTYNSLSASANNVYYAYCAGSCANSTSWGFVILGVIGDVGGDLQLQLTPDGHPRVFWRHQDVLGNSTFEYAVCDGNCLNSASWTTATVGTSSDYFSSSFGDSHYFALDSQGRPRFIYNDDDPATFGHDSFYRYCDANCTNPANWSEVTLTTNAADTIDNNVSLAFDSSNRLRVMYYIASGSVNIPDNIFYRECDAGCNDAGNWSAALELYLIASTHAYNIPAGSPLTMRLDHNGQPRIVYYSGQLGGGDPDNTLFYAWCNANCTSAASWGRTTVGLAAGNGDGADLAFDSANRPRIVYANGDPATPKFSLGYGVCSANCESSTPTWQHVSLEDPLTIPPAVNIPPCTVNVWYIGADTSLALDSAGNPRVAYDAYNVQSGGCTTGEKLRHVRFTTLVGLNNHLYLPLVAR